MMAAGSAMTCLVSWVVAHTVARIWMTSVGSVSPWVVNPVVGNVVEGSVFCTVVPSSDGSIVVENSALV